MVDCLNIPGDEVPTSTVPQQIGAKSPAKSQKLPPRTTIDTVGGRALDVSTLPQPVDSGSGKSIVEAL